MRFTLVLALLSAVLAPPVLALNGVRAIASGPFVRFEYDRLDPPPEARALPESVRLRLALVGLRAVEPGGEGIELLRRERLPDGTPAFTQRELRHMADVRAIFAGMYLFHLVAGATLAVLVGALAARRRTRALAARALGWGGWATLLVAAAVALPMLLDFGAFFDGFHNAVFEGRTWQFRDSDTLIRVYPQQFWNDVAWMLGAATVAQALLLVLASRLWRRTVRQRELGRRGAEAERRRPGVPRLARDDARGADRRRVPTRPR